MQRIVSGRLFLTAALLLCVAPTAGAEAERIRRLARSFEAAHKATVGLSVVDLRGGAVLSEHRPTEPRILASNQKLLTSAFALARLGADFQFRTRLHTAGKHLVVVGDFDPTSGDPRIAAENQRSIYAELDRWAAEVSKQVGVRVEGDLFVVTGGPKIYHHPDWPARQRDNWYAAPVARINFHDNCFDVTWKLTDGQAVPEVTPASRFIRVDNQVRPGKRHLWRLRTNEDDSVVTLTGTIRQTARDPLSQAVNDPPLLFGRVLADRLVQAGVRFDGRVRTLSPDRIRLSEGSTPVAVTATPLAVAMRRANKRSLNMMAEGMFLRAGDGTWLGSARIMRETLVREYGLDPTGLTVRDGGGLSHGNRVSPANVTKLLAAVAGREDGKLLLDSLPVSGVDGSLRGRLEDAVCKGRVLGKTGYVANASCLSGYVLDAKGKPAVAFSILCNAVPAGKGWKAHELQEAVCREIVAILDAEAEAPTRPAPD